MEREGALPKSQLFNSSPAPLAHSCPRRRGYIPASLGGRRRARSTAAEGDRTVLMLRARKKYSIYHVHWRRRRRSRRNNLNNYAAGIFGTIHQDASERGARARPSRQSGLKIFSLFDFGGRTDAVWAGRARGALTLFISRGPL